MNKPQKPMRPPMRIEREGVGIVGWSCLSCNMDYILGETKEAPCACIFKWHKEEITKGKVR
jgi:hypothetical protein